IDANYTHEFGTDGFAMVGGSYQRGTAYCQPFPVVHFTACNEVNPAWAAYGQFKSGPFLVMGEFAKTTKEWPGTFNPTPPLDVFAASKVTSFGIGGTLGLGLDPLDVPEPYDSEEPYIFHFPDGNAGVARLAVAKLIPNAVEASTMEEEALARVHYDRLDLAENSVRIRLSSTAVEA
ncbi:hypothetical protein ACFQQA_19090, partial [Marinobacter aromaticivorans]